MSKFIIEVPVDAQYIMINGVRMGDCYTQITHIEDIEELNSDYINEHYGELQDEAYQKGINDGSLDVKQRVEGAYQAGLNDAWEAVKKIFGYEIDGALSIDEIGEAFGYKKEDVFYTADIIRANTAEQVIAKLKAYEEKQEADEDDKIEVGDVVRLCRHKVPYIVTSCDGDDDTYILMTVNGGFIKAEKYNVRKTGRHFDIMSILEDMRHD